MATATLRTLGGSVVMTIPKPLLDQAHLRSGAKVDIQFREGCLVVLPHARPSYSLAELLAQCNAGDLAPKGDDVEWLNGGPVGEEVL